MTAWLSRAGAQARARALEPRFEHVGIVEHVGDGVAEVSGLPWTRMNEILQFDSGGRAMALRVEEERVGCILLGGTGGVEAGTRVRGTGEIIRVPVGDALLGRVVDSLGAPLDDGPAIDAKRFDPIDRPAPDIVDRALVTRPLMTGLTVVDAMVPLGRGQRELIIGDRKTGKTAIAVDTMINQRESDVLCVYAAIGQKASTVNQVVESVRKYGAIDRTIFVVGEASASPGTQWVTPYAACTMAEYFRDRGQDVLLILDDLTKHAMVYRTLSLLLRRPPGREAYPGDVFYIHSRLLERAANLAGEPGGSLTALPIAETQAGNLTAYIPTNLISITDGQIYLDSKLFYEGQKPAVNSLRLEYAQFLELEVFTRFGSMADERAKKEIEHGRRIRAILSQSAFHPLSLAAQSALLLALDARKLDAVALEELPRVKEKIAQRIAEDCPQSAARVEATGELSGEDRANFLAAIDAVLGIEGDTGGATAQEV